MEFIRLLRESWKNAKAMKSRIDALSLDEKEKNFLKESLYSTGSFEKAVVGVCYYEMENGERYGSDVFSVCGDYNFLVRVVDNIVDGHLNMKIPENSYEFINGIGRELSGENVEIHPNRVGMMGAMELAKDLRKKLSSLPRWKENRNKFAVDMENLIRTWRHDSDREVDYEERVKVGGLFQLTICDIVESFPDISRERSETVRKIAYNSGIIAQLIDDKMDGDKGVKKREIDYLLRKYWKELDEVKNGVETRKFLNMVRMFPVLSRMVSWPFYKRMRNIFIK
jgi:hypothetical protein